MREAKEMLGERLYALIKVQQGSRADKITCMCVFSCLFVCLYVNGDY